MKFGTQPFSNSFMKSAILSEPKKFRLIEIPVPEPRENEIRVKVQGCGICASDLPVWEGRPWFAYPAEPGAPGHEAWGYVDANGPGVRGIGTGDSVAFLSYHGYSEYDTAPADQAVVLPEQLRSKPFPAEPLACAMNIFRRSGIGSKDTVAIVGIGFQGALLANLAAHAGARVIAISRRSSALEIARRKGASEVVQWDGKTDIVDKVAKFTGHRFCECVIEATGRQEALDLAAELTAIRGRLIIAGYHQDGPRSVNLQLWNWKGLDVINAHERDPQAYVAGIRDAIDAVLAGGIETDSLYTHRFSLENLDSAFAVLKRRPDDFLKGLVMT